MGVMTWSQRVQWDGGETRLMPSGRRYTQTFRNDPMQQPNQNATNAKKTGYSWMASPNTAGSKIASPGESAKKSENMSVSPQEIISGHPARAQPKRRMARASRPGARATTGRRQGRRANTTA